MRNSAGAQQVDVLLTPTIRKTLITEYYAGRLNPAAALRYLINAGVNTGGLDRHDISTWLRAQPQPTKESS